MPKAEAKRQNTKKATKPKKDADAPKRALSAYMFMSRDWREKIKEENPGISFGQCCFECVVVYFVFKAFVGQVGKVLGQKWKEMSKEEKKPYEDMAEQDKERAENEKKEYDQKKKSKANGKDSDENSDEKKKNDSDEE